MVAIVMLSLVFQYWVKQSPITEASYKVISIAVRHLGMMDAVSELEGRTYQIDGFVFNYVKCENTPLILRYTKNGEYSGLEFPAYKNLLVRQNGSSARLQGFWLARGLLVDLGTCFVPDIKGIQYESVVVKDNVVGFGTRFVPLMFFFEMDRHYRYSILCPTFPNPTDRKALNDTPCLWTAHRCLIPCGKMFLVVTCCRGRLEISIWFRSA